MRNAAQRCAELLRFAMGTIAGEWRLRGPSLAPCGPELSSLNSDLFSFEQVGWLGFGGRNRARRLLGIHDWAPSLLILLRLHGIQPFTKPGLLRPLPVLPALSHIVWLFHGNPVGLGEQSIDQPQANTLKVISGALTLVNRRIFPTPAQFWRRCLRRYTIMSSAGNDPISSREASRAGRRAIAPAGSGYRANRCRRERGISIRHEPSSRQSS